MGLSAGYTEDRVATAVTAHTLQVAAEAMTGQEPLPIRRRRGNRGWQPPRKAAPQQTVSPPSHG